MKVQRFVVALSLALSCAFTPIAIDRFDTPISAAQQTVKVKEHTRKDDKVVKAHQRKAPDRKATTAVVQRDEQGRIQRSAAARHAFARRTGYPNGRPGWIIDHIVPLACGGADAPSNMQWQTAADAKAKDRWERQGC